MQSSASRRIRARNGKSTRNVAPWPRPSLSAEHRPAVRFHEVPDDRETEAESAVLAGLRRVHLPEPLEQMRPERGSMPCPLSRTTISAFEFGSTDLDIDTYRRLA